MLGHLHHLVFSHVPGRVSVAEVMSANLHHAVVMHVVLLPALYPLLKQSEHIISKTYWYHYFDITVNTGLLMLMSKVNSVLNDIFSLNLHFC